MRRAAEAIDLNPNIFFGCRRCVSVVCLCYALFQYTILRNFDFDENAENQWPEQYRSNATLITNIARIYTYRYILMLRYWRPMKCVVDMTITRTYILTLTLTPSAIISFASSRHVHAHTITYISIHRLQLL